MKIFFQVLGLGLLLFGQPRFLSAQTTPDCQDIIRLRNGSILRGEIQAINGEGQIVVFKSWNGATFDLHQMQIRKITQRCKNTRYNFKEKGWYHHTRTGLVVGQLYYGPNKTGFHLQHSSGWMFSRQLGLGLGTGIDYFSPGENDAVTYPIFAELQGFLLPNSITPFYSIGAGWAFTGRSEGERWGLEDQWKGGWLAQAAIGYRIGNHFSTQFGIRLQHKRREWTSTWGPDSGFGVDRILHSRLILAVGLHL